jgi:hypothetical protein
METATYASVAAIAMCVIRWRKKTIILEAEFIPFDFAHLGR